MRYGYKIAQQLRRKAPGRDTFPPGRHGAGAGGETRRCNPVFARTALTALLARRCPRALRKPVASPSRTVSSNFMGMQSMILSFERPCTKLRWLATVAPHLPTRERLLKSLCLMIRFQFPPRLLVSTSLPRNHRLLMFGMGWRSRMEYAFSVARRGYWDRRCDYYYYYATTAGLKGMRCLY